MLWHLFNPLGVRGDAGLPNGFYFTNTVVVLGLILGGTMVELNRLKAGGVAVAAVYYLAARMLRSRTARGIRRREDLLHPPGSGRQPSPGA